jgi:Na+-translocating ferredoxin:NAD+ oxidoreductase subunit B
MSENEIYRRFTGWLNQHWWKTPETEHLLPALKKFFTLEEADLLTGFPFMPKELGELAQLKKMEPDDLAARLESLARKGVVWKTDRGDHFFYHLNDAFFIFFRGPFYTQTPDEATRALAGPLNKYFYEGVMKQLGPAKNKPLRTVPVQRTIEDPRKIIPYEDVLQLLDSQDFFALSNCSCRQRKKLDPETLSCDHPLETCIHFGKLAHYLVENGLSRQVTKEEVLEVLQKAADSGLIHAVSNREEQADTICNCCRCSCLFFESFWVYKQDKSHDFSNYQVKINPETCQGCGLCTKRCPMEVLKLEEVQGDGDQEQRVALDAPERCLGCGLCVHKCPTRSLILEQRKEITCPPKNVGDWAKRWMADHKKIEAVAV